MQPTYQSILNGICNNLIANGIAWMNYREVGRDISAIQTNLLLLYNAYWSLPYLSLTDPGSDLEKFQNIVNITVVL